MKTLSWIKKARNALGIKGFQLAELMQVSPARVSVLEKDELRGAVTLKMMQKAASAMGCRFEYRIVPDASLDNRDAIEIPTSKPRFRLVNDE